MSDKELVEQLREEAIRNLWELKLIFDKVYAGKGKVLKYDYMLKDESYRNEILNKLAQLKHNEIAQKASAILKANLQGSLYNKKQSASSDNSSPQNAKRKEAELKPFKQAVLKWKIISALLSVLLLVSVIPTAMNFYESKRSREILVDTNITSNTLWSATNTYILTKTIYVEGNAELQIEAGTLIKGEKNSALVVTQDAQLIAKGTELNPIVFTSNQLIGSRNRGDWGGLVLLGNAPVNIENAHIEGISEADARGFFGGQDKHSSCGVLEYVRVEFAGSEVYQDNELNGLTLGGCGDKTIVRHVQVHKALDDGIEVFGGNVNLKNILITGPGDDAFDWDMGWRGNVQFLIVQLHHDGGDNAFEGDSHDEQPTQAPVSEPNFYNVTLLGANSKQIAQRAMLIRDGSGGKFFNFIVTGFSKEAVDLRGDLVAELINQGPLIFSNSLFFAISEENYFPDEEDDDLGFDELAYFSNPERQISFGLDPRLPAEAYNAIEPKFTPFINSPALENFKVIPQGEFWDEGANYLGAIRPGVASSWMDDWTSFPSN